jgi:hypothetical protein
VIRAFRFGRPFLFVHFLLDEQKKMDNHKVDGIANSLLCFSAAHPFPQEAVPAGRQPTVSGTSGFVSSESKQRPPESTGRPGRGLHPNISHVEIDGGV